MTRKPRYSRGVDADDTWVVDVDTSTVDVGERDARARSTNQHTVDETRPGKEHTE